MSRIGGSLDSDGVVIATTASFCLGFNRESRLSFHCLLLNSNTHLKCKRIQIILTYLWGFHGIEGCSLVSGNKRPTFDFIWSTEKCHSQNGNLFSWNWISAGKSVSAFRL